MQYRGESLQGNGLLVALANVLLYELDVVSGRFHSLHGGLPLLVQCAVHGILESASGGDDRSLRRNSFERGSTDKTLRRRVLVEVLEVHRRLNRTGVDHANPVRRLFQACGEHLVRQEFCLLYGLGFFRTHGASRRESQVGADDVCARIDHGFRLLFAAHKG